MRQRFPTCTLRVPSTGDIKPENVLVSEDGTLLLADFGISKLQGRDDTRTVQSFRSPVYSPPEHADSRKYVRDIFSLGVLIIQSLTSEKLQDLPHVHAMLAELDVPEALRALLQRSVAVDAGERPEHGAAFHQALTSVRMSKSPSANSRQPLLLRFTTTAETSLGGPSTSRSVAATDLEDDVFVSYRIDEKTGARDRTRILVVGREYRYTVAPENAGDMVVIGAKKLNDEDLDRQKRRSLPIGHLYYWTHRNPLSFHDVGLAQDTLMELLDDFHDTPALTGTDLRAARSSELIHRWERVLRAREDVARAEHGHALAQVDGLVDSVGDEDDGLARGLPDPQQFVLQLLPGLGVQGRKRFVHQQDVRLIGEASGDGHALLHTAGQFVREAVPEPRQSHQVQEFAGFRGPLLPRKAGVFRLP